MNLRSFLLASFLILSIPTILTAQKKPGEVVTLKSVVLKGEPKPGTEVTAMIQFSIESGFHVQANPASEPQYIPAVLKLDPVKAVVTSAPIYPEGKEEKVAGLAIPLKVYDGCFEIRLPIRIASDAKLPVTIPGVLTYQACRGSTCFPPKKLKVEISVAAK